MSFWRSRSAENPESGVKAKEPSFFEAYFKTLIFTSNLADFIKNNKDADTAFKRAGEIIKGPKSLNPDESLRNFKIATKGYAADLAKAMADHENAVKKGQIEAETRTLNTIIEVQVTREKKKELDEIEKAVEQKQKEQLNTTSESVRSITDQEITEILSEKIAAKLKTANAKKKAELLDLIDKL